MRVSFFRLLCLHLHDICSLCVYVFSVVLSAIEAWLVWMQNHNFWLNKMFSHCIHVYTLFFYDAVVICIFGRFSETQSLNGTKYIITVSLVCMQTGRITKKWVKIIAFVATIAVDSWFLFLFCQIEVNWPNSYWFMMHDK